MSYRVIKITPSLANKYLELNTKNRTLRQNHVAYLIQLILDGEWRQTGEPIRFSGTLDKNNLPEKRTVLLDGQHRLTAFLASGKKSLLFEVIDELPVDSFQYMDQGRPRSAADVLTIDGYKNTNVLAGVGRALYLFDKGGIQEYWKTAQGGARKATNHEILDYVRQHEKPVKFAIKEATHHIAKISMSFAAHASSYYLFRRKSVSDCEKFFYLLGTGEKLTKTNPIYHLRGIIIDQRLHRKKLSRMSIRTRELMILNIIAWNAFRNGERIPGRNVLLDFDSDNLPKKIV